MKDNKEVGPIENPEEFKEFKELVDKGLVEHEEGETAEERHYNKVGAEILKLHYKLKDAGLKGDALTVATARAFGKAYLMTYLDAQKKKNNK